MPACYRSLLATVLLLTAMLPAAAQDVALPREPQIGPRPWLIRANKKERTSKTPRTPSTRTTKESA